MRPMGVEGMKCVITAFPYASLPTNESPHLPYRLLHQRVEILVSEIVHRLSETNEGERVGGIEKFGDDWRGR